MPRSAEARLRVPVAPERSRIRPRKIAVVNQPIGTLALPPGGAIEICIYEIARRVARAAPVVVYARRGMGGDHPEVEHRSGVRFRRMRAANDLKTLHRVWRRLRRLGSFFPTRTPAFASLYYYWTYAFQVARDIRSRNCDIVHVHNFFSCLPILRALNPSVKIILHMHCEWLTQVDRSVVQPKIRHADRIIGCSEYITDKIRRQFPELSSRCATLYNGVDVELFARGARECAQEFGRRLLFVGRITPEKGLHVLIDAFQRVANEHPDIRLEIIGPDWQTPLEFIVGFHTEDRVSELTSFYDGRPYASHLWERVPPGLTNRVIHPTGLVPHQALSARYRGDVIFVNASLSDSFPLSILEAMASGVPIVATRVGGVPEAIVDGETGLLVEPGDAQALAHAISRLLTDSDLRRTMANAAREKAVNAYSWDRIAESTWVEYDRVLS